MTKTDKPDPNSQPEISRSDQIADVLIKLVMTGGVTAGGAGAFWSLFKDSDIPKAIASGVIGLGISLGASFLKPLHKGMQDRLAKAGESANKALDHGIAKVSGLEKQYFQCQARACRRQKSEGVVQHDGIFLPLLEEIYVPLQLDKNSLPSGLRESPIQHPTKPSLDWMQERKIWDLLGKDWKDPTFMTFSQIGVLAWGGYGKTTLLKHIAYTYGMNQQGKYGVPRRIPFLLVLRKHRDRLAQAQPPTLPELIKNHHIPDLPDSDKLADLPEDWVLKQLNRGEAVVMLDGFDEVASGQRPAVARWINDQMRHYSKSVFIITSRPKAYREQEPADCLEFSACYWVQDFNEAQRRDFVEHWYLCQERYARGVDTNSDVQNYALAAAEELLTQIEARQELKDLAKNPLLLNMIVTFHRLFPGVELPKRKVELYQEIFTSRLRPGKLGARKLESCLINLEAQSILQRLALSMMQAHEERLDRATLLERISTYLEQQRETVEPKDFLAQVVQISELLVERELGEFEFAHLSLQEYLAATQIADDKQEVLLYEHLKNDWWKQTILLYASQVNPTQLIREALRQKAIDLANTIKQDTTKRSDLTAELAEFEQLTFQVETSVYAPLEQLLKTQQWREADQETYRLMITTVGKEEGQVLNSDDLGTFPCEDLQMLDRLWVKYSNGKWGFSVQKRIWEKCGSPTDYDEFVNKFCDLIGWTKNGVWHQPKYDLGNSLAGELPTTTLGSRGLRLVFGGDEGTLILFFSRTKTCRL